MKRAALVLGFILLIMPLAVQADFGTNWTAAFYDNTSFSGDPEETISGFNGLNFNWPGVPNIGGNTVDGVGENNFSVRFTSTQTFTNDTYRFDISVDDNIRVFIDGEQVFEDFTGGPVKVLSFTRVMTAGSHTLRVDFVEVTGAAVIQFQWFPQGFAPTAFPTGTPIPPATASVSASVRGLAVRTGPYLGASMITVALPGESYPLLAKNPSEDGVIWYQINKNGQIGWSSGRYLEFNVDPGGIGNTGSVFDTLDGAPETGVIGAPRSIMNLRARPSARTALLAQIPWGAEVPILNRTVQGGQDRWYQVRYEGQVGWIFAPYIAVRGDIRNVPIV
jgi:uncharacterized protein YraI